MVQFLLLLKMKILMIIQLGQDQLLKIKINGTTFIQVEIKRKMAVNKELVMQ